MGDALGTPADVLAVTRAQGCGLVHLKMRSLGDAARTLCDVPVRLRPPSRLFQQTGCPECARVAVEAGFVYVREKPHVWVNLRRVLARSVS